MSLTALLPLIIKYWPVIKVLIGLIRDNSGKLDDLIARPDTCADEDCKDFLKHVFEPED